MEEQFLEAAENADLLTINRLISKGVNVNCEDKYGNIAIHLAAIKGNKEIIEVLLKTGKVDVNCKEWNNRTPIYHAIDWSHFTLIEYLVEMKADFNSRDSSGETALHRAFQRMNYCCLRKKTSECANTEKINECITIKEIFEKQKKSFGEKCVWFAIIAYFFENGNPNFDIKDIEKKTPLDYIPENERQFFVNLNEEIRKKRVTYSEIKIDKSTIKAIIEEMNSFKKLFDSNEYLKIEIEELKKSFSKQTSELNEIKNNFLIYENESSKQMVSMKTDIVALKRNLIKSNFENENLKKEVEANNSLLTECIIIRTKEISEQIEYSQKKIMQEVESMNTEIANLKYNNEKMRKEIDEIRNFSSILTHEINDFKKHYSSFKQEKEQINSFLILNENKIKELKDVDAKREEGIIKLNTCFQQQSAEIIKFMEKYNLLLFENLQLKDNYESLRMENKETKANIDSIKNELKSKFDEESKRFQLFFNETIVKFEQMVKNVKDIIELKFECELIHKPNEDLKKEFKKLNKKMEFLMSESCENCRKEQSTIKSLCGRRVCENCYGNHNIDENSSDRCHLCFRIRKKTNF